MKESVVAGGVIRRRLSSRQGKEDLIENEAAKKRAGGCADCLPHQGAQVEVVCG